MDSGEYIQMSGRAGRRGKDDRGLCIVLVDQDMEEAACRYVTMTSHPCPITNPLTCARKPGPAFILV